MSMSLRRKMALRAQAAAERGVERRLAGLSRAGQVARSTVPVGEVDLPVVETLESVVDTAEVLPGVIESADQAGSDAYEAWDQSEFAKNLAEELGVNVGDLTDEVSAAASAAAAAQGAADAAQLEAETARSEASSKAAAAEAAAKAHADAEAEAARLAAVAAASGDASAKAAAAQAAAEAAAAADASAKAAAAEAAAKADAAAAQSTANDAASAAAAAQSAAGSAADLANQAQATASGKNKIYRSTAAPSGVGSAAGDKWERYDTLAAGGKLQGTWAWSGSAWVSTVLSETYLPLVNIGSGTYGTLAGARLAATAIDGMTITGALIRTAPSGQRLQLDVNGLRSFNEAGSVTAILASASGGMEIGSVSDVDKIRFVVPDGSGTDTSKVMVGSPDSAGSGASIASSNNLSAGSYVSELRLSAAPPGQDSDVALSIIAIHQGPRKEITFNAPLVETKFASAVRFSGAFTTPGNTFSLKSQLDAWAPIAGTHAWVTSEGREYVRSGGVWKVAYEDTPWANAALGPNVTGTARWRRYMGVIYVEFNVTSSAAIAGDGLFNNVFTLPMAAWPGTGSPVDVSGQGTRPAMGNIGSLNGVLAIRNLHTGSVSTFYGSGQWLASDI